MNTKKFLVKFFTLSVLVLAALSLGMVPAKATELIVNGNFESGSTGWTLSGEATISTLGSFYHSSTHYLWCGDDNGTDIAYQDVTIPGSASAATLSFYYNINTSETSGSPDTFSATIRTTGGTVLATVGNWSNLNGTSPGVYTQQTYNLLPYAGQTIRIYFASSCTLTGGKTTNFRIDDVSVSVTTSTTYTINVSASPNAGGTISGGGTFASGSSQTVTATANSGYTFANWTENSSVVSSSASYNFTLNGNRTLVANFTTSGTQPLGVDVSVFNGTINWGQVSTSGGKAFAFIRATAGINTTDANFAQNAANAHSAGLLVGAYHFAYPQSFTAQAEAQKFLSVAGSYIGTGYLPPTLDIEDSPRENSYPYLMGQTALSQWIRDWCSAVKQATGVTPMVYATRYYANNYFDANLNQFPFWVPTYSSAPTLPNSNPANISPWSTWTFQQYQSDPTTQGGGPGGTCPGITGYADLDSFNGNLSALQALANPTVATTPSLTSPTPGSTLTSSSATFQWSSGSGVSDYFLYVGSSLGANDIYGQDQGLNQSVTVNNLPQNGSTLYVRLYWEISGAYYIADYTYDAFTQHIYTVTLSASPSAGGIVSGGGTFTSGSSQTVTATANSGYTFANWTENGSVVSSSASYNFTLNGNRNLIANFTANLVDYTISLNASPAAGGTVSGGGTFLSGSSRTVTATANSGYTFANWTENGSVVSSSPSFTFALASDINLVANFVSVVRHPSFFNGEIALTGGVYYLVFPDNTPFGFYNYASFPIFYHYDMGFMYFFDANDGHGSAYFYDFASQHFWFTSPQLFPYMYDFNLRAWLYYYPNTNATGSYTSNPRSFYNFATGKAIVL